MVHEFISNVPNVGKESITDYLIWQWRKLDKRFNYLNLRKFTKQEENKKSGADFELELWLVGKRQYFPLLIQAKKFIKTYDCYCIKLNYLADKKRQIELLLEYAKKNNRLPFYLIYSIPDRKTEVMCPKKEINPHNDQISLFLADAYDLKEISDNCKNIKTSKNSILKHSNPFFCLFCCPLSENLPKYFSRYYPEIGKSCVENGYIYNDNNIPHYVRLLIENSLSEINKEEAKSYIKEFPLEHIRNIAIIDMREEEKHDNGISSD